MLISILVANYNNGHFFEDCLKSVLAQSYQNWEMIVVDDGSTDDSIDTIKEFSRGETRIRIYENNLNRGCGFTKRLCVDLANGVLCGFLDPDDALLPNALAEMHKAFIENPKVVLAHSTLIYCDEDLTLIRPYINIPAYGKMNSNFFNLEHYITAFAVFKKEAYLKTVGIDSYIKRAVDQDLYLKMDEIGPFLFLNKALYLYRQHRRGISSFGNMERAQYWHWFVINEAAKRRGIFVEDIFIKHYVKREKHDRFRKQIDDIVLVRVYKRLKRLVSSNKK